MDFEAIGAGVAIAVALIGGNAFVMKLIIDNSIKTLHLLVAKDFVTKDEFEKHIEHCPHGMKK